MGTLRIGSSIGEQVVPVIDAAGNITIFYFRRTIAGDLLIAAGGTESVRFAINQLTGSGTVQPQSPTYDTQRPTDPTLSAEQRTVTMPLPLISYTHIVVELEIDLHLNAATDIHQIVFSVYPNMLTGETGTIEELIVKSGGGGGLAVQMNKADFTATATSFNMNLVQLLSGGSLTSSFRVLKIQGVRFIE